MLEKKGDRILFSASSYPHPLSFFFVLVPPTLPFLPILRLLFRFAQKKSHRRSSKRRKKTRVENEAHILAFPPPPPPYPVSFFSRFRHFHVCAHLYYNDAARGWERGREREEGKEGRILTSARKQRTSPPPPPSSFDRGNFPCRQLLFPISPFVKTAVNDGREQTRRSQTD